MRMTDWLPAFAGAAMLAATLGHGAMAQGYAVETRSGVPYAEHDGVKLTGELYLPKGLDKAPILIAAHGGGWQGGNPDAFKLYGPYLAKTRLCRLCHPLPPRRSRERRAIRRPSTT